MNRQSGIEITDGCEVGRDPRRMSAGDLENLGHERVSPMRAIRLKCLDCCNNSAQEVRLCTAVDCPSWPFRMGKNPWRSPISDEARAERSDRMRRNISSASSTPDKTRLQNDDLPSDGVTVPSVKPDAPF